MTRSGWPTDASYQCCYPPNRSGTELPIPERWKACWGMSERIEPMCIAGRLELLCYTRFRACFEELGCTTKPATTCVLQNTSINCAILAVMRMTGIVSFTQTVCHIKCADPIIFRI